MKASAVVPWVLVPAGVLFLLYVGNPTGARRAPSGTIRNFNCRKEGEFFACDFVIEQTWPLSPKPLGRFLLDGQPKQVVVDGVQRTLVTLRSGWYALQ